MIAVLAFLLCVICPAVLPGESFWLQSFPSWYKEDMGMHQMTSSKPNPLAQAKSVLPNAGNDPQYLEIRGLCQGHRGVWWQSW